MTSKRKTAKLRKMEILKVVKQINKYKIPYNYRYGGGYFIFTFDPHEFNMHLTFKQLPLMKFGIWKIKNEYEYFAECVPYIDKFKPSYSTFTWDSLDEMMQTIKEWIINPKSFVSELKIQYCSDSSWKPNSFAEILLDHAKEKYRDSHHGFDENEYESSLKKFNELVKSIDTTKIDFFWRSSDGFKNLYDVWYYVDDSFTNEEIKELEDKLWNCNCFSFQWRPLPNHFFKKPWLYKYKIHPDNKSLYFNQKKHLKLFNRPDKS